MIGVVSYGVGNIGSILNMLKKLDAEAKLVTKPDDLLDVDQLILPGVGAFDNAMIKLSDLGLDVAIVEKARDKSCTILGICLGMQLLANCSEEGDLPGLGLIPAIVNKFNLDTSLKIPHMGWNTVEFKHNNPLLKNLEVNKFYFVHSYHVVTNKDEHAVGTTLYDKPFTSMVRNENVFGAQFHPEKSHRYGMQLFRNFLDIGK